MSLAERTRPRSIRVGGAQSSERSSEERKERNRREQVKALNVLRSERPEGQDGFSIKQVAARMTKKEERDVSHLDWAAAFGALSGLEARNTKEIVLVESVGDPKTETVLYRLAPPKEKLAPESTSYVLQNIPGLGRNRPQLVGAR